VPTDELSLSSRNSDRVLVTGATGLLGQHLVRQLLSRGYRLRALVRTLQQNRLLPADVELVYGDIRNPAAVAAAVAGCRYVFHACCTHVYNLSPQEVWAVNVDGTRHVCDAVKSNGCEKLIFTSTASTLKRVPGPHTPGAVIPARQRNTVTKQVAEDLVLDYVREGLPAVIVNPTFFVGSFDYHPSPFRLWFPLAIISRVRLVPGGGFNVVGTADVASAHLWALDHGSLGERYLMSGENISLAKFVAGINMAVGRPGLPKTIPDWFLRLMAHGYVFDSYVAGMLSRLNYVDEVSPVPKRSLDQVIHETVQWFSHYSPLVHTRALVRYVRQRYV
jgi:dihydroflavonol-4-reductase